MPSSRLPRGVDISAHNPEFRACPHDYVEQLRAVGPCYPDPDFDRVVLTGLAASRAMLLRPDVSVAPRNLRSRSAEAQPGLFENTILQLDPPEHDRLRAIISRAFSAAQLNAKRAAIKAAATELLDAMAGAACFDVRSAFAAPLATRIMADLLGIERALHPHLVGWVGDLEAVFDPTASPEAVARMHGARQALLKYFRQRYRAAGVASSPPGLMDELVEANAAAGGGDEIVAATGVLLLGAGISTTTDLITNGLRLLLTFPDQLNRLRAEPSLIPHAVEEVLRLEPPVAQFARIARQDLLLEGTAIAAGVGVTVSAIATGCDPAVHKAPRSFDIARAQHTHLAFAAGIHACPGSQLARMEAAIGWSTLLDRFPRLRLGTPVAERRASLVFNGWERLDVRID